ncbi:MAG: succinylglutamate-semialdehyde dehydrogenase [Maricaulis sp.]|jgi:succinylglutamic semialdehyde dehydrogenase|nr:succinylglutamate-semialdehyde dehydrogenase [Maricaulis sp.]MDG2044905.1 succinylglutamate-semialdehyde dehydrogenase [Maricaulis sp.]
MNYINGSWTSGDAAAFTSTNPADDSVVWEGAAASPTQVDEAFAAARAAFSPWARRPLAERVAVIEAYRAELEAQKPQLAELIARETGKPLWETTGEAGAMIGKVAISIKSGDERTGGHHSDTDFGYAKFAHKPLGVMFVLGPYNFPGHLPNGHIIPALLAGNTVVFKPSEITPAVGEFMVRAWESAGLPAGVLNLVHGARETGAAALDNSELDGVLFTGSWGTGKFIHEKFAGRTGIMLALEMGGNNPLVVWDAADVDAVASIAVHSTYITAGQRCSCARRLILPEGPVGDAIVASIVDMAGRLSIGRWNDEPAPFIGPLVSAAAANDVLAAQADLIERGATAIAPMQRHALGPAFVSPGLIDVTGIDVPDEEVFGPLIQVIRVKSFDAAIDVANDTAYGLSSGLVSDDEALWNRFWVESRAGIVNWNRPTCGAASNMPFGGPGQSGNLRPSAYYAADYCAYPVATQAARQITRMAIKGID